MPQQTSMTIYQGVALECQHCYMICRYSDANVRHSCPSCGRSIENWTAVAEAVQQNGPEAHHIATVHGASCGALPSDR